MKKGTLAVSAAFLVCILLGYLLLFTTGGFAVLVAASQKLSGGSLKVGSATGILAQSFSLEKLRYSSKGTTVELESMTLAWQPGKLFRKVVYCRELTVDGLYVRHEPAAERRSTSEGGLSLAEFDLPVSIDIERAEVTNSVFESGDSGRLEIDSIVIAVLAGRKTLELDTLTVTNRQVDLDVSGTIGLGGEWPVEIDGQWRYAGLGLPSLSGSYSISESLADGLLRVDVADPVVAGLESGFSISNGLTFEARLLAEDFDPSALIDTVRGSVDINIHASGRMQEEVVEVDFTVEEFRGDVQSQPLEVSGEGRCSTDGCRLENWRVVSRNSELRLSGEVGSMLEVSYELDVGSLGDFLEGARGTGRAEGSVEGKISSPRILADLGMRSLGFEGYSAAAIDGDIEVDLQNGQHIEADLVLKDLEAMDRQLDAVEFHIAGSPDRHRLKAELKDDELSSAMTATGGFGQADWQGKVESFTLSAPHYSELTLASGAQLQVNSKGFSLQHSCLESGDAGLCLEAEMQEGRWQAAVEMARFDPALFWEEWSGSVNAELEGYGTVAPGAPTATLTLSRLDGSLRGREVDGGGKVVFDGRSWRMDRLELYYGGGMLSADGTIDQQGYAVDFRSELPDISLLRNDLQGMLKIEGMLAGPRQKLRLDASVEGGSLAVAAIEAEEFEGTIGADFQPLGSIDIALAARNIMVSNYGIDEVGAEVSGTMAEHTFSLNLTRPEQKLKLAGDGSYDGSWRGHLHDLSVTTAQWADFTLRGRPSFRVDDQGGAWEDFCLTSPRADFCASGRAESNGRWQAQTSVNSFDLTLLGDAGLVKLPVAGDMSAELSVQGLSQRLENIEGWIEAPRVVLQGDTDYTFLQSRLDVFLEEETLVGRLRSNIEQKGDVEGQIRLKGFAGSFGGNTPVPLSGRIDADIYDLGFITNLTDSLLQPSGHLRASIDIGGSLEAPIIGGAAEIEEGEVYLADQGITLENVSVTATYQGGELPYEITATSGPGRARGEGTLSFGPDGGWKLRSHLTGSNFEVMATEEYVIRTSPDVRLGFGEGEQFIEGRLDIPYARVVLERQESRISPSSDVVIVDEKGERQKRKSDLVIDIDVDLGEDVKIDAYGLESSLRGDIELKDSPGSLLSATGELQVEDAEFSFYSVELKVTRGRLLFSGGPIDNPGVDFRAVRKVENRMVGVEVNGTAQDLQFQLFSDPAMSDSDILAYMLVGRSMYASSGGDQSLIDAAASSLGIRGVNRITSGLQKYVPIDEIYLDGSTGTEDISLVLGKYITENLFLGYDHNFFDRTGELKARYDLGNNFSVETRSSTSSTSGDILYSIEK